MKNARYASTPSRMTTWWAIHRRDDIRELVEIARERVKRRKKFLLLENYFFDDV
jgi:hypothetical protein